MNRTNIYLPEDLLARLDAEAKDNGISRSEIIRKRLLHSYQNEVVYIDYVNAQFDAAQQLDNAQEA
jgi:metal-responsive CopG/Arc/MetJ family transcriptional regulator